MLLSATVRHRDHRNCFLQQLQNQPIASISHTYLPEFHTEIATRLKKQLDRQHPALMETIFKKKTRLIYYLGEEVGRECFASCSHSFSSNYIKFWLEIFFGRQIRIWVKARRICFTSLLLSLVKTKRTVFTFSRNNTQHISVLQSIPATYSSRRAGSPRSTGARHTPGPTGPCAGLRRQLQTWHGSKLLQQSLRNTPVASERAAGVAKVAE